jgi:hypothetical protein
MIGDELITITIENAGKKISTRYSVLEADLFKGSKGEYHLLCLDSLMEKFKLENTQVENYYNHEQRAEI